MRPLEFYSTARLARAARKSQRTVDRAIADRALFPDGILRGVKRDAALWLPESVEKIRVALSVKQPKKNHR